MSGDKFECNDPMNSGSTEVCSIELVPIKQNKLIDAFKEKLRDLLIDTESYNGYQNELIQLKTSDEDKASALCQLMCFLIDQNSVLFVGSSSHSTPKQKAEKMRNVFDALKQVPDPNAFLITLQGLEDPTVVEVVLTITSFIHSKRPEWHPDPEMISVLVQSLLPRNRLVFILQNINYARFLGQYSLLALTKPTILFDQLHLIYFILACFRKEKTHSSIQMRDELIDKIIAYPKPDLLAFMGIDDLDDGLIHKGSFSVSVLNGRIQRLTDPRLIMDIETIVKDVLLKSRGKIPPQKQKTLIKQVILAMIQGTIDGDRASFIDREITKEVSDAEMKLQEWRLNARTKAIHFRKEASVSSLVERTVATNRSQVMESDAQLPSSTNNTRLEVHDLNLVSVRASTVQAPKATRRKISSNLETLKEARWLEHPEVVTHLITVLTTHPHCDDSDETKLIHILETIDQAWLASYYLDLSLGQLRLIEMALRFFKDGVIQTPEKLNARLQYILTNPNLIAIGLDDPGLEDILRGYFPTDPQQCLQHYLQKATHPGNQPTLEQIISAFLSYNFQLPI